MSRVWRMLENLIRESAKDAGVWPEMHFDPEEVDDPDGFETLNGTVGSSDIDGIMYHPDHWDAVDGGKFPDDRPDQYWYRTDTNGYVALRAKTPEARAWLSKPEVSQHNDQGKRTPGGITRKGSN